MTHSFSRALFFICLLFISTSALSQDPNLLTLPSGGNGILGEGGSLIDDVLTFFLGPWMIGASALVLGAGFLAAHFMPNSSIIEKYGRLMTTVVSALNIPALINLFIL